MTTESSSFQIDVLPFSVPALIYQADSPKAVVVLLPALGTAAGFYGPFAESLRTLDLSVLVPELPGTGASLPRPSWGAD